jgi:hypothetical protein
MQTLYPSNTDIARGAVFSNTCSVTKSKKYIFQISSPQHLIKAHQMVQYHAKKDMRDYAFGWETGKAANNLAIQID